MLCCFMAISPTDNSADKKILDPASSARQKYDSHCTSNPYKTAFAQIAHHNMCNNLAYIMGNTALSESENARAQAALYDSQDRLANTPEAIAIDNEKLAANNAKLLALGIDPAKLKDKLRDWQMQRNATTDELFTLQPSSPPNNLAVQTSAQTQKLR
jgi:hypothetical protein